jgi:hypothetical protein
VLKDAGEGGDGDILRAPADGKAGSQAADLLLRRKRRLWEELSQGGGDDRVEDRGSVEEGGECVSKSRSIDSEKTPDDNLNYGGLMAKVTQNKTPQETDEWIGWGVREQLGEQAEVIGGRGMGEDEVGEREELVRIQE